MSKFIKLSPLKRFFSLLKVDKQEIISVYVYALFQGLIMLSLPLGIQAIINLLTGGQISTSWIILVIFVIVGVILTGVMQIMQLSITENIQQKIFTRSAFEFAYRIPKLKLGAVDKIHVPELVNRFFDTLSVQKGLSKILMDFSSASLQIIFGLVLLSLYHSFFILFSLVLLAIVYVIFRLTAPEGLRTSLKESSKKYEVAHWLEELGRAMETFKLAGKAKLPLSKTDEVVTDYLNSRKAHFKTLVLQYIYLAGFKVIIAAGLLLIGGLLVINQQMNIGQFVAAEIIIILVLSSVEKLILSMETIYDVLASIEKIGAVADIPLERDFGEKMEALQSESGLSIDLKKLSFKFYEQGEDRLKNINMSLSAGEKVCLSGFDGAGKSLLLQIIAGLYDEFRGSLTYNSLPLGNWCMDDLRSMIGDSLTREDIFKGTLRENLSLGKPDVTIDEIQEIIKVVNLSEFVETLTEGYNTMLQPEGKNLPKNVRLKLMIARSLIGKPKLIMLEDSFNQLNYIDRTQVLNYLLTTESTVIAVSNEYEVAEKFERVIVLEDGKLIGDGKLNHFEESTWFNNLFKAK